MCCFGLPWVVGSYLELHWDALGCLALCSAASSDIKLLCLELGCLALFWFSLGGFAVWFGKQCPAPLHGDGEDGSL